MKTSNRRDLNRPATWTVSWTDANGDHFVRVPCYVTAQSLLDALAYSRVVRRCSCKRD